MAIYLAITQQETLDFVTSRLHLYNLQPRIWGEVAPSEIIKGTDLLITDQTQPPAETGAETGTETGVGGAGGVGPRLLRLGVDLTIPGDEELLYQLSETAQTRAKPRAGTPATRHPLLLVTAATGKSGATRLVTHPRLLPFKPGQGAPTAPTLIRVNLLEDPGFARKLAAEVQLISWQGNATATDFIPQRLPAGEVAVDGDFLSSAPTTHLAQILQRLARCAPVIVDAGRLNANLIQLAEQSSGQLLLACTKQWKPGWRGRMQRLFTRPRTRKIVADTLQIQAKWELPLVANWQQMRAWIEATPGSVGEVKDAT